MTLVELLVVLSLLGVVGATITAMVLGASRVAARTTSQLVAERTMLVAGTFLRHALRDAQWSGVTVADDAIALERPVGEGALCGSSGPRLWLRRSSWRGDRAPDPTRDRLQLWPEGGTTATRAQLTGVANDPCPDGAPAWRLERDDTTMVAGWVRVAEATTVRRYRVGSSEWLGLSDGAAPVQPFAGPLQPGASRFARIGGALQVELATAAGARQITIPLEGTP